MIFNTS